MQLAPCNGPTQVTQAADRKTAVLKKTAVFKILESAKRN